MCSFSAEIPDRALATQAAATFSDNVAAACPVDWACCLMDALPDCLMWRNALDVLAQLPAETKPEHVAVLPVGAGAEVVGEDLCGAVCISYLVRQARKAAQCHVSTESCQCSVLSAQYHVCSGIA